jgi:hypothetical protein
MSHRRPDRRHRPSPVTLPVDAFPTPDEIASRAHCLARAAGGRAETLAFWRQAEQELLDIGARRTLAGETSSRGIPPTHRLRTDRRR